MLYVFILFYRIVIILADILIAMINEKDQFYITIFILTEKTIKIMMMWGFFFVCAKQTYFLTSGEQDF